MQKKKKKNFPIINFYDQDLIDLCHRSWTWIGEQSVKGSPDNGFCNRYFRHPESNRINQFEACLSTFFLVYSNNMFPVTAQLDNFYNKQEDNGAICSDYDIDDGCAIISNDNPSGVGPPLFSWAEFNLYHKLGSKKRLRDIIPRLESYFKWLEITHKKSNGLYSVSPNATMMGNSPRTDCVYPVDFNAQQAVNALYMSAIGDVVNDKDLSFKYKKAYFSLKSRINQFMWNEESGFYHDLDSQEKILPVKTIAGFWTLLAEIPNEVKCERLLALLRNPKEFGVDHPFPSLSASETSYSSEGNGFCGSVSPAFNYMVIKGLEKYGHYDLAREYTLRHLYYVLDSLHPEDGSAGSVYEAYSPQREGPAKWPENPGFPRKLFMCYVGLTTVALMIENVIGLYISLPRKTVDWRIPVMEQMGVQNFQLKRTLISILSNKTPRGWEIRLESEKLYYLTINVLREKRTKTLPIPSGKCSILIDKL